MRGYIHSIDLSNTHHEYIEMETVAVTHKAVFLFENLLENLVSTGSSDTQNDPTSIMNVSTRARASYKDGIDIHDLIHITQNRDTDIDENNFFFHEKNEIN